jgi:predicted TIM-barrel fold metal-dependent hydrolase
MWIPKWKRDHRKGVDSPMPTQVCSNEEFYPRPQNEQQAKIEALVHEMAGARAKKLGLERRQFLRSSMGLATAFLASNTVYGKRYWDVDDVETWEPAAIAERFPQGEYFVMDVQAHFTNGLPLAFRSMEFVKNMGFTLDDSPDAYGFPNFIKEMYFDSETDVLVISGVPGKEYDRAEDVPQRLRAGLPADRKLEGAERTPGPGGRILPSWIMSMRRDEINRLAESTRALCQGNCAPNHYWNRATDSPDFPRLFDQMEREIRQYRINSWKWYCHFDPGQSGHGFRCDDEKVAYPFFQKSKELGMRIFSVHKGYSSQSATLGHLAHPGDLEKAAKDHPDITFVVYHSAVRHGPFEADAFKAMYDPTTGDFEWHADLMRIRQRNPQLTNLYPELGSAFNMLAIAHPEMCMHLMGRNIKYFGADHVLWGTDCLWWGSPQWAIDAFKRFQISDEIAEKWGYAKLTREDKAKILGLNAAKIYGVDPAARRNRLPDDVFSRLKKDYERQDGPADYRSNAAHGWVRDDVGRS